MNPGADYFGWDNIIDYNLFTQHDPSGNTLDVGLLDLCSPDNESIIEPSLFQVHADFPSDVATANVALPERECTRKRGRSESCSIPGTKACREKMRREKLNEKFVELNAVLEPGRTPKIDKPAILDDAIRVLNQLRTEGQELKETNEKLLEEIKTLKADKHELREEKLTLKADKDKIEQQLKSMAMPPQGPAGYMPAHHPAAAAYHAQANKMPVYPSYGFVPMWNYMPSSTRDTSHDHVHRPPAA